MGKTTVQKWKKPLPVDVRRSKTSLLKFTFMSWIASILFTRVKFTCTYTHIKIAQQWKSTLSESYNFSEIHNSRDSLSKVAAFINPIQTQLLFYFPRPRGPRRPPAPSNFNTAHATTTKITHNNVPIISKFWA